MPLLTFSVELEEIALFQRDNFLGAAITSGVRFTCTTDYYSNFSVNFNSFELDCENGKSGETAQSKWIALSPYVVSDVILIDMLATVIKRDYTKYLSSRATDVVDEALDSSSFDYQED